MTRRRFLTEMLALGAAPAIVRASSLMKIATPTQYVERFYGYQTYSLGFTADYDAIAQARLIALAKSMRMTHDIVCARLLEEAFK